MFTIHLGGKMNLTYRQLQDLINALDEDHIDDNVTIFDPNEGEFFGVRRAEKVEEDKDDFGVGILDEGCLFLVGDW